MVAYGDVRGPTILAMRTSGKVTIPLAMITRLQPFNREYKRNQLIERLNTIPGIDTPTTPIPREQRTYCRMFIPETRLEQFVNVMDWIVDEIEQAAAGGPSEPAHEDYVLVLTHIPVPRGQQQLYKALYDAGDQGLTHEELVAAMGRRDLQDLSGVLGALGRRISGIPGYGEAKRPGVEMVISYEQLSDGQQRLHLVSAMRRALEELDPDWLADMTI
jgi:hypothetical protein